MALILLGAGERKHAIDRGVRLDTEVRAPR